MIISKKITLHLSKPTLLLPLYLCLLIAGCDNSNRNSHEKSKISNSDHRVEVVLAENKSVNLSQTITGTLEAVTLIRLYNEESGRITRLPYHEGDHVRKGELLIQMDNELLKTDVAKARANKDQEKLDLERLKKLLPKKISTEEEVAQAKTELNLATAEEKRQLARLRRTTIKAPIDGLITQRLFEPGDMLAPLSHIHTIIDPTALHLKASIAERWIPLIVAGQAVDIHIDALGDKVFKAKIARLHPTIDADTHKGTIEFLLKPVPEGAQVGQFARATIELKASDRLVLPTRTVHFDRHGSYVYRIITSEDGNSLAEKRPVKLGQQFDTVYEILSGVDAGDKIVIRGYLGLRDDKKVEIVKTLSLAEATNSSRLSDTDKKSETTDQKSSGNNE